MDGKGFIQEVVGVANACERDVLKAFLGDVFRKENHVVKVGCYDIRLLTQFLFIIQCIHTAWSMTKTPTNFYR